MGRTVTELTPIVILNAYSRGIFPMAESRDDDEIFWLDPKIRGVMPLDGFHISRSLKKKLLREPYDIKINTDFTGVVEGCADRDETWINKCSRVAQMHPKLLWFIWCPG